MPRTQVYYLYVGGANITHEALSIHPVVEYGQMMARNQTVPTFKVRTAHGNWRTFDQSGRRIHEEELSCTTV